MAQILIFGDSITDGSSDSMGGWADRLKQYYWRKNIKLNPEAEYYWVYNLGISGNKTEDVLKRINIEAIARKAERKEKGVVFVFAIGINDSSLEGHVKPQICVDENQFAKNYEDLIRFAKNYTPNVLCIGITPVDEARTNPIYDVIWYKNERIRLFNDIIEKISSANSAKFIEMQRSFKNLPTYENLLFDGLHPNDEGHTWLYERIKPEVEKLL